MNEPRTFAEWLTWTREEHGYSKNSLANASGVDRSHLFKMEKGQITEPADETRHKLHAVFGTSDDELVTLGLMRRREYPRAEGTVAVYEYVKRPQKPSAGEEAARLAVDSGEDAAFVHALMAYLPALGPPQRAHLIDTARYMADAAITRASSPAASDRPADEPTPHPLDRPEEA